MVSELISAYKGLSRRHLLTVLTLLWMLLIFHMSSAVKDDSNAQSGVICGFLCEIFVEGYEEMPPAQQLQMQERFSFPVRKGAHLTEYTILGVLLTLTAASYRAFETLPGMISCKGLIPLLIGFLYAVSDEIHQYFVPGRAMQARDVLIDTVGVLLGICICRRIIRLWKSPCRTPVVRPWLQNRPGAVRRTLPGRAAVCE